MKQEAAAWAALALAGAAFLLATACMPPPPSLQRPTLGAGTLRRMEGGVIVRGGFNNQAAQPRVSRAQYEADGFNTGGGEGSVMGRLGLGRGSELDVYLGAPDIIPGALARWQFLGRPGREGALASVEAGFDLVFDVHAGLALGGRWGAFEPWGVARLGRWAPGGRGYWETGGGLALRPKDSVFGLIAGWSHRGDILDGGVMAEGPSLGVDLRFGGGHGRSR